MPSQPSAVLGHGGPNVGVRSRARELVLDDLRNGYVTEETTREVYGLAPDTDVHA